ncbi:26283_t:CDS:2, partial [Gigaspora rosea]
EKTDDTVWLEVLWVKEKEQKIFLQSSIYNVVVMQKICIFKIIRECVSEDQDSSEEAVIGPYSETFPTNKNLNGKDPK